MARGDSRQTIRLVSTESPTTYWTTKNKKNTPERLEIRKYDPRLKRHALFRESR